MDKSLIAEIWATLFSLLRSEEKLLTKATTRFLHKKSELKVYVVMEVPFHSTDNQLMNSVNVTYP